MSRAVRTSRPIRASSPAARSVMLAMWRFGTTRTWVGALGSMSWNAITSSSWRTTRAGILPEAISQNRQDTADEFTPKSLRRSGRLQTLVHFGLELFYMARALAEIPGSEGRARKGAHHAFRSLPPDRDRDF